MLAFISYSHKDRAGLDQLHAHLAVLRRAGRIQTWFDREILAGGDLDREIGKALRESQLFIPLVSPDYLNSPYAYGKELEEALRRRDGPGRPDHLPPLPLEAYALARGARLGNL